MTHIINGMAGNIESHSTLDAGEEPLNITAVLDFQHYGFNKLRVINATAITFSFIQGGDGSVGDELTLLKRIPSSNSTSNTTTSSSSVATSSTSANASYTSGTSNSLSATASVTYTTEVVTAYTTYCPGPTVITQGSSTYTVTQVSVYQRLEHC